jgi:polyisoprenoid-binding protein YceI
VADPKSAMRLALSENTYKTPAALTPFMMKSNIAALLLTSIGLASSSLLAAETYEIDPAKSKVTFVIDNKAPGASGYEPVPGSFKEFSGTTVFDKNDPSKSSVTMEVKTASIDTANKKRDDHLRSQDFFKVKEHPTMSFQSTKVTPKGKAYEIEGTLTLLGETKPITATFEPAGEHAGKASFKLKRSDFGMSFRVPDTADEVDVTLELVGKMK